MDATTQTTTQIAASKVNGTSVYNTAGESIGKIYDVMLDKQSGKVAQACELCAELTHPVRRVWRASDESKYLGSWAAGPDLSTLAYAIMSFGGFLGMGDSYHPLPSRRKMR